MDLVAGRCHSQHFSLPTVACKSPYQCSLAAWRFFLTKPVLRPTAGFPLSLSCAGPDSHTSLTIGTDLHLSPPLPRDDAEPLVIYTHRSVRCSGTGRLIRVFCIINCTNLPARGRNMPNTGSCRSCCLDEPLLNNLLHSTARPSFPLRPQIKTTV